MKFERARTDEQVLSRKQEIRKACATLYDKHGINGVTFKAIGDMTSFARSTIYNYYKTKEEVLLDLLSDDLKNWTYSIKQMMKDNQAMTKEDYCKQMTTIYANNMRMLKLLSILSSTLEQNSSLEKLIDFKKDFIDIYTTVHTSLQQFFPESTADNLRLYYYTSTIYIQSLYPTTHLTDKQIKAMSGAGINYEPLDFKEICYQGLLSLSSIL